MKSSLLFQNLDKAFLLRPEGVPKSLQNICLICLSKDLECLPQFFKACPQAKPEVLIVPDLPPHEVKHLRLHLPDGSLLLASPPVRAAKCPQYEKVFICPRNPVEAAAYLTQICRFLARFGISQIYLFAQSSPAYTTRQPMPDFYAEHAERLENAFNLFADYGSKMVFGARLKAIMTGSSGYIPVAAHQDYFFPGISPEPGDIMIDGGVSDMVEAQTTFIDAVGEKGKIYGFEPIPRLWASAIAKLTQYPNYHLECAGLSNIAGEVTFEDLRDSSHIATSANAANTVICAMETIDAYCKKNNISHIDCIKLDVEGAELAALKGAAEIIKSCKPKLIICLYHKPVDLYEIPEYIKSLVPDYNLYLSHTSCQFIDTVLYAKTGLTHSG